MREQFEKSLATVYYNLDTTDSYGMVSDIWWAWYEEGEEETATVLVNWGVDATTQDAIDLMESVLGPESETEDATEEIMDFICEILCKYFDPEA